MENIGIISSGCLVSSKLNIWSSDKYIIYASSLAVYVINAETFGLEKVIPVADRTLVSITVNPHNPNELLATALDGFLTLWHLQDEECMNRVCLEAVISVDPQRAGFIPTTRHNPPHFLVAWDLFNPEICGVVLTDSNIRVLEWNTRKQLGLEEKYTMKNTTNMGITTAAYNPHTKGMLAVGCTNGWVLLVNTVTESSKPSANAGRTLQVTDRTLPVVDLQWDRLSAIYLLVAYQTFISLWDSETGTEIHTFEKQPTGITSISWLDWTAGNFVSTNAKNGIIKIWNASQKQSPLESIRVANSGILSIHFGAGTKRAVCGCYDGSIIVYHFGKKQLEYSTFAGHTETIFDCCFSPKSPDVLATCSYDRTVKLWGIAALNLTKTLQNSDTTAKCIIYRCSWSPKADAIAASTSDGFVLVWEIASGREVARYANHNKPAYCVAWNKLNESYIASVAGDHDLVVLEVDLPTLLDPTNFVPITSMKVSSSGSPNTSSNNRSTILKSTSVRGSVRGFFSGKQTPTTPTTPSSNSASRLSEGTIALRFAHPAPVFGCSWSEHERDILATSCRDMLVRIFDCSIKGTGTLRYLLRGHTQRAFCACWSPLVPGLLATGSDDSIILLWQINFDDAPAPTPLPTSNNNNNDSIATVAHAKSADRMIGQVTTLAPLKNLAGHKSNIRALSWNYEAHHLLLSGSWDSTIRVWDVEKGVCLLVVCNHVADIYSIVAHPSRPFTYLSCSRDSTVRLWELSGAFSCMRYLATAQASLDTLLADTATTTNSQFLPSSSSSGTQNVVSVQGPTILDLLPSSSNLHHHNNNHNNSNSNNSSNNNHNKLLAFAPILSGRRSQVLKIEMQRLGKSLPPTSSSSSSSSSSGSSLSSSLTLHERIQRAQKYHLLYNFFTGANGSLDIWEGVLALLCQELGRHQARESDDSDRLSSMRSMQSSSSSSSSALSPFRAPSESLIAASIAAVTSSVMCVARPLAHRVVRHESDILDLAKKEALMHESVKMGARRGDTSGKVEEQLRRSALLYIRTGDVLKYCTIMVELNEWTEALAVAPAVSMDYWKSLAKRYGEHLATTQSSEQCIPSLIASGSTMEAVRFYLQRQDVNSALVVAKMAEWQQKKLLVHGSTNPSTDASSQESAVSGPGSGARSSSLLLTGKGIGNGLGNGQPAKGNNGMMLGLSNGGMSIRGGGVGDRDASPSRPYLEPLHDPPHALYTDSTADSNGVHTNTGASSSSMNSTGVTSDPNSRSLIHSVNTHVAAWYLSSARPHLAAAQLLSVGDVYACVNTLSLCGEHDLAYAVALCTGIDIDPYLIKVADILVMFAVKRMENMTTVNTSSSSSSSTADQPSIQPSIQPSDQPSIQPSIQSSSTDLLTALSLLNQLTGSIYKGSSVSPATAVAALVKKTPKKPVDQTPLELLPTQLSLYIQEEKGLLLVRYADKEVSKILTPEQLTQWDIKDERFWLARAGEEEAIGSDADAALAFLLGRDYTAAATLAIKVMKRHVHEPFIDDSSTIPISSKRLLHGMKYMRASLLEPNLRAVFLSYLFWYAAHDAAAQSLWETAWNILRILQQKIDQPVGIFPSPTVGVTNDSRSDDQTSPPGSPSSSSHASTLKFPYTSDDLFIQELVCRLCGGERMRSLAMIEDLLYRSSPAAYGTGNIGNRSGDMSSGSGGGGGAHYTDGSPRRGDPPSGHGGGSGKMKGRGSLVLSEDVIATLTRLEKSVISDNATGTTYNDKQPWRQYADHEKVGGNTKGTGPGVSNGIFGGPISSSTTLTYDQDIKLLGITFRLPIFKHFSGSGKGGGPGQGQGQGQGSGQGPSLGSSNQSITSSLLSTSLDHTVVAKGSTLPGTRARPPHARLSSLTERPLQGVSVTFNIEYIRPRQENESATSVGNVDRYYTYAGINEVLAWKRVLPFAPDFSGNWID